MREKFSLNKRKISFFFFLIVGIFIFGGCVSTSGEQSFSEKSQTPILNSIMVDSIGEKTLVEITSNQKAPYTSFKLADPPRVVLDIRGAISEKFPKNTVVEKGNIRDIVIEPGKTQALTTRMVVNLTGAVNYHIGSNRNVISMMFIPEAPLQASIPKAIEASPQMKENPVAASVDPSEPRIFVKPGTSDLNQVLGIDFTMLNRGKSRLTVTTDKKAKYDLNQNQGKTLILKLQKTTIPAELLRQLDSSYFQGVIKDVVPSFSAKDKLVTISISLKEMVPFNIKENDREISIDFDSTSVKPPEKKKIPALAQEVTVETAPASKAAIPDKAAPVNQPADIPGLPKSGYAGEPMTLDFVNADITNILRLIAEVSQLNIVWGPEVSGNVSMRLKGVPWDQALDLILMNNNLAKRETGNVVWITTNAKMNQVLAEERRRKQEYEAERERRKQQAVVEQEKEKGAEPLITEYLPVDFATADEIRQHIILSDRGTISVDARTNTIIIRDIASVIDEAKNAIKQFDTPVKQIMIEARIVDATDDLSRDLGIQWNATTVAQRSSTDLTENPSYGGSFSTNSPTGWAANIGLNLATLTSTGLGAITLDAQLALAESEGKSKTISAPKVIAREGTAASISSGDTLVIPATENVASTTLNATLSLSVTPTSVSYNNYITMDVNVTDDQAPSSTLLKTKAIATTLMVKSGDTIVIGGILKENESEVETGIPGLRDIPGLGWLFKANNKVNTRSELLIFITPTVMPSPVKNF